MNDLTTAGKLPSSLLRRLFLLCWFVATVAGAQTSEADLFRHCRRNTIRIPSR